MFRLMYIVNFNTDLLIFLSVVAGWDVRAGARGPRGPEERGFRPGHTGSPPSKALRSGSGQAWILLGFKQCR